MKWQTRTMKNHRPAIFTTRFTVAESTLPVLCGFSLCVTKDSGRMAVRLLLTLKECTGGGGVWTTRGDSACASMFECASASSSQLSEKDDLDEASKSSEMLPRKAIFPCCMNRMVSTAG